MNNKLFRIINDYQYILLCIINMSHLRDIQKMRLNRNINSSYLQNSKLQSHKQLKVNSLFKEENQKGFNQMNQRKHQTPVKQSEIYSRAGNNQRRNSCLGYSMKRQLIISNKFSNLKFQKLREDQPRQLHSDNQNAKNLLNILSEKIGKNQSTNYELTRNVQNFKKELFLNQCQLQIYQFVIPIGKGGFGKVWKVKNKKNYQEFAIKIMDKAKIISRQYVPSVINQRNFLAQLQHPFIINMHQAFQTRQNLYVVMDYLDGGDLRYHLGRKRRFQENQTKFFIANIIIGLQYLRQNKIIHRDIKPENLVFDSMGYLRITDLGISRHFRQQNKEDKSGTAGYMSPQVICRKNHSYSSDYFAVGVIGYEIMLGRKPYNGSFDEIRQQMMTTQITIKPKDLPYKWSADSADFINKLLISNPKQRLGHFDIQQIKQHKWMKSINWQKLSKKEMPAVFIPRSIEDYYEKYKKRISNDTEQSQQQGNNLQITQNSSVFQEYNFNREKQAKNKSQNDSQSFKIETRSINASKFNKNYSTTIPRKQRNGINIFAKKV